ncbi:tRNA lysidine(34) synthetase TilS [Sphaerisporangium rubeum]|uniref:tRNA lysidine(34) synthetase TilS n=1 Tax=Sphaerisporangium rubeum TaxID=321317 RepID=UPI00160FDD34|nr:tRNA lysidine(34) synthetase TilS [Sphaerisporangium rubeum]
MGPHPAVAEIRRAVRGVLDGVPEGALVLVACSGGGDSLALAAGVGFVGARVGMRVGVVSVDHGLQEGSAERARDVVRVGKELGLDPAEVLTVSVGREGGPEAAARQARYAALGEAAVRLGASAVLLGHTLDDQAETVLMRLARGSGTRSLAGMPAVSGIYRRPLLKISRATTRAACEALGLVPWDDPHNEDPAYTRVRVRHEVLPVLERAIGPGVAEALARTASLCRDDADALDLWADEVYARARSLGEGLRAADLGDLPGAVRRRVILRAALDAGADRAALGAAHIEQVERLVTAWRGQRLVELPGGVGVVRRYGTLIFASTVS